MRITITDGEYESLKDLYMFGTLNNKEYDLIESLLDKAEIENKKEVSPKKVSAAKKATDKRTQNAKKKIENALNLMRLENKPISVYLVAKEAGVSYNTANKYQDIINKV